MIRSRIGSRFCRGGVLHRNVFTHIYNDIISVENLLLAWKEFIRGKRKKSDVQVFQYALMHNILELHTDLKNKTYHHGGYQHFKIADPKSRDIHKASVRDRLLHHAIHRILYPYFDSKFIHDSYSSRTNKGTHRALNRFRDFVYKVSKNHTKACWVLKCDIRKFFASINQQILMSILEKHITDTDILRLLKEVISSFQTEPRTSDVLGSPKGLPLGNLTSQLLVNIYMNEFDQFVKHILKETYYIRYADDFVFLHLNKQNLRDIVRLTILYLWNELRLELHPHKVSIATFASGVDFLGWVHFPCHRVLRTATKKRVFRKLEATNYKSESVRSYVGLLRHGHTYKLIKKYFRLNV